MEPNVFDKVHDVDLKKTMEQSYIDSVSYTHLDVYKRQVDIQSPDYETRMAILRKKEEMEGYNIDNEVIKYIATNIKSVSYTHLVISSLSFTGNSFLF